MPRQLVSNPCWVPQPPLLTSCLCESVRVQGAEGRILVQLKPWLIKHKPTILLSMHVFLYPEDAKLVRPLHARGGSAGGGLADAGGSPWLIQPVVDGVQLWQGLADQALLHSAIDITPSCHHRDPWAIFVRLFNALRYLLLLPPPPSPSPSPRPLQHEAVKEVLYSYKTLLLANGDVIDRNAFSVAGWCRLCTLILTEEELPAGFATWKEALAAQGKK